MIHNILRFIKQFILIALVVITASLVTTYFILKHHVDKRIDSLDKTAHLISNQIESANLNSILAFTGEHFIFIVHQRDGRILFQSGQRTGNDAQAFSAHRDDIVKEMLRAQEGWITFPETEPWKILTLKKIVRFLALDELNWVVAVELPGSVTWQQLVSVYSPLVWAGLIGFCLLITGLVFFLQESKNESPPELVKDNTLVDRPDEEQRARAYSRRLIREAKKALNSDQSETERTSVGNSKQQKGKKSPKTVPRKQTKKQDSKKGSEKEAEATKKQAKSAPEEGDTVSVKDEREASAKESEKDAQQKGTKKKEKSQSAIYFEKLMESRSSKKNQPDTIIGQALSKKSNRENIDK